MTNHPPMAQDSAALLAHLDALTEAGQLRRLGGAFARFVASLAGPMPPPLTLACVVLSELEGRGHSCLMLDDLLHDPAQLLGWTEDDWRALLETTGPLPKSLAAWRSVLAGAEPVWCVGDLDFDQPMVLDGPRLYLRRYWRDEATVARQISARAVSSKAPDVANVRHWLDILFTQPTQDGGPDWQKIACAVAMRGNVAIITGGPGTGKTYTVASLLTLLFAVADAPERLRVSLAAPTGKAAARLKQSIDNALASLAGEVGQQLALAELTKRMGAARTLHSLLGARPDTRAFRHHAGNPLDVDVVIVDEASMVHLEMMAALLAALPPTAMLVLLGDKDQLASVEAGAVLGDLCHDAQAGAYSADTLAYALAAAGQLIPPAFAGDGGALAQQTVMLRHSHRFSGPIGALATAVNDGDVAAAQAALRGDSGGQVLWMEAAHQADVLALALSGRAGTGYGTGTGYGYGAGFGNGTGTGTGTGNSDGTGTGTSDGTGNGNGNGNGHGNGTGAGYSAYLELIRSGPQDGASHEDWVRSVLRSFESFRILCAVRDGEWGVSGLNTAIEQRLERAGLIRRGEWYVGRPVMITRNDYSTGVFNGDIGLTLRDPERPASLRVYFLEGDNVSSVLATRLRHVETAYAMTVHKSQGSEFLHTVLVLPKEGGAMLARELVYTGITRARQFFTLVTPAGSVLQDAITRRTQRASGLRGLLA